MIKTVKITGHAYNQDGSPASQAIGRAVLSTYEIDGGVVVPNKVDFKLDENGYFEIVLWPNQRGQVGSHYSVKIYSRAATFPVFEAKVVVPDVDYEVDILSIIDAPPYPPVDEAQQAVLAAKQHAEAAKVRADEAFESATNASNSAAAAKTSETNSKNSATDSENSAIASAASASDASTSASDASDAATIASNKASEASSSASTASNAATTAQGAASTATTKATEASTSASEALSSAAAASNSAGEARTYKEDAEEAALVLNSINITEEPAPDSIPLSDENGKINENWLDQTIFIKDPLRQSVEAASGGSYTVIYTPKGQPSFMFRQPVFNLEDIDPSGQLGEGLHPAFIFNGVPDREIFVGAYPAAEVNGEIVCQPGLDPRGSINFGNARAACQALGAGWDLMSNWDWAAIALWCAANGFSPRGNTNYGRSHSHRFETATRVVDLAPGVAESSLGRTLTGSGPAAWTHDGTGNGIHDLVGNVFEWVTGLLLEENIFKIAPDNGVYSESEYIDTLVEAAGNGTFSTRAYDDPPLILKQAMAVPTTGLTHDGYFWKNETGQRLPRRGGYWGSAGNAGLDALALDGAGASASTSNGFRPRFRVI